MIRPVSPLTLQFLVIRTAGLRLALLSYESSVKGDPF